MTLLDQLSHFDPEVVHCLHQESIRQNNQINLIASENYASPQVVLASNNALTNKYAEGYPGKRYYAGCEFADIVENLAIERAKKLFNVDYVNVQPHSGSQANQGVFHALLSPGDTILGMDLSAGGHLTHGCPVNSSGKTYHAVAYGVNDEGLIDYDAVRALAVEHKPKLIIAGFSAYPGILDWAKFRDIADEVGAYLLADIAHVAGLIAAGLFPSPADYADVITTTTHKTLRGPRGGMIMAKRNPDIFKKLNSGIFPGVQGGPLMHVIAAKAVAYKEALSPAFIDYQKQVMENAHTLAETLKKHNVSIVSNQTLNHLVLINLMPNGLTGKKIQQALEDIGIVTNKNTVPNDTQSPFVTSGIRIGTPAITTRGMKADEVIEIGNIIAKVIHQDYDEVQLKEKVANLASEFPISTDYLG
ncbi:MAG: serine hydroxymethyltransferase [Gammaproteobacteria bacterium]|nr:serine hydroxymethyltransferase [Gammaproteobacteria bacterium]